ncbi:MAG: FAD-binding oxidoreductase [Candidatus Latescibacterota bacterium]
MKSTLFRKLEQALGADQTGFSPDSPAVLPREIAALSETMRIVSAEKGNVTIAGGGTVLPPVSPEDTITVSLACLSTVREVSQGDFLVVAEAGAIADHTVNAARKERMHLPLDITSGARATIGGAYMTAAIGPYAAGYGPFRDYVIGAKCVTARGDVVTFGGRTMKNVTGYEITRFLSGTHGLFAIAAELTLKALPLPERQTVLIGRFRNVSDFFIIIAGVESVGGVVKTCELVAENGLGGEIFVAVGLEGMEPMVLKGERAVRELLGKAGVESVREEATGEFTRFRRAASLRMVESGLLKIQAPPSASATLLRSIRGISPHIPVIAHPLAGRIHVTAGEKETATLGEKTLAVGGKRPAVWNSLLRDGLTDFFTPPEHAVARALKRELDPDRVLNPYLRLE